MGNKLLLIDTFYFLHRSFHAYPKDMQNSKEEYTNITFGVAQSLLDSIAKFNPTHIACGWESEEQPSFRKELYGNYQITRVRMDFEEEMVFKGQLPRVIELLEAFNIPRITQSGFEGDDILGTVANLASKDAEVTIATADQDLLQLITDKIHVYRPGRPPFVKSMLFDHDTFKEHYGFEPIQMIDYKALRGDPSDSIPGVKGIGDKTAKVLLEQFGSIEEIYENLSGVTPIGVRNKLEADKEAAFMSKQLATIITDIPMEFNLDSCVVHDFDVERVRALFNELEFFSLNKKLDILEGIKKVKDEESKKANADKQVSLF
jgi:DNA polymerase-1